MLSDLAHTQTETKRPAPAKQKLDAPQEDPLYPVGIKKSTFTLPRTVEHMCQSKPSRMFHPWLRDEKRRTSETADLTQERLLICIPTVPYPSSLQNESCIGRHPGRYSVYRATSHSHEHVAGGFSQDPHPQTYNISAALTQPQRVQGARRGVTDTR